MDLFRWTIPVVEVEFFAIELDAPRSIVAQTIVQILSICTYAFTIGDGSWRTNISASGRGFPAITPIETEFSTIEVPIHAGPVVAYPISRIFRRKTGSITIGNFSFSTDVPPTGGGFLAIALIEIEFSAVKDGKIAEPATFITVVVPEGGTGVTVAEQVAPDFLTSLSTALSAQCKASV